MLDGGVEMYNDGFWKDYFDHMISRTNYGSFYANTPILPASITPKKIIRNDRTTIVIWEDGSKTIVRCEAHKHYDAYEAFTAALAKKIFSNNTKLKKMILERFTSQT